MSTKVTITSRSRSETNPAYHRFRDVLDEFGARDEGGTPTHLRIDGVVVELQTLAEGGTSMTVTLPQELGGAALGSGLV